MIRRLKKEIDNNLKSLQQEGTFGRNIAIRSLGSTSAYLVGFLLSPIIARIYQPEAYGQFAIFNAMVATISILATLNFTNAFVLPRSNREFIPLVQLTFIAILSVSLLSIIVLGLFGEQVLYLLNIRETGSLIYFLPIFVFFTGVNRCLDFWNVRETEYRKGATAKIVSVVGAKIFTIGIGLLSKGNLIGFILGDLFSRPVHTYSLLSKSIRGKLNLVRKFSWSRIKYAAWEFRNYPIYNMPATGLIVLAGQLPIYLLSFYFGANMTGHFSLAFSLTAAPIQVLGMSVASVFYQKAVETYQHNPENLQRITTKLLNSLILLGVFPFGVLVVFGEAIFRTVFGINWETAGVFAGYMGFMAFANFISVSLNALFRVVRKEKLQFYINLSGAVLLCSGLFFAIQFGNVYHLVLIYSLISALLHLVSIAVACYLVKINPLMPLVKLIGGISLVVAILYALRNFYLF